MITDPYNNGPLSELLFLKSKYEVMRKWWHETLIMDAIASIHFEKSRILTLQLLLIQGVQILSAKSKFEFLDRKIYQTSKV